MEPRLAVSSLPSCFWHLVLGLQAHAKTLPLKGWARTVSQVGDKFFVEHPKSVCILDTLTTTSLELLTVLADADIQHS